MKIENLIESGGELVHEELIEPAIDGGYWCEFSQTWELDGEEWEFTCQGSYFDDERTDYGEGEKA